MQVNPSTIETPSQTLTPITLAVQSEKQVKPPPAATDQPNNKPTVLDVVEITDPGKELSDKKPSPVKPDDTQKITEGVISHIVITYNQYGAVRTKFVDSRNNLIYQIPPEMVAKMEDLMGNPETSTNSKS